MNFQDYKRRTWAEVDLDALVSNFLQLKGLMKPETKMMAVVKSNAYGHGAVCCAKALLSAGADYLAVAALDEALELRRAGISAPILILGYLAESQAETLIENNITATVYNTEIAGVLSRVAERLGKKAKAHLKVNSGMERLGFEPADAAGVLSVLRLPGIEFEGIFSHLACADCVDSSGVHVQYQNFMSLLDRLQEEGHSFRLRHILNSAGIIDFPEYQLDMVRPGISLYGYYPSSEVHTEQVKLMSVMAVKTRVAQVRELPSGTGVSYGWTFVSGKPMRIATVPIGYADGYHRVLSNQVHMIAKGNFVPVLGRICMDQCMIDVSSVNTISEGDEIIIIGKDGDVQLTADDLGNLAGTISYEILCAVGRRVPRLYLHNGEILDVLNGISD